MLHSAAGLDEVGIGSGDGLVRRTTCPATSLKQALHLLRGGLTLWGFERKLVVPQGLRCEYQRIAQVAKVLRNLAHV